MIYYQNESLLIRGIEESDFSLIEEAFQKQGWNKPASQYAGYYREQQEGARLVFVAFVSGAFAGYVTLLPNTHTGPFAGKSIPEISDFNVLEVFQRQGIGSRLMDAAEKAAAGISRTVSLGVGLHAGYGSAQRMYVKRGYIPDGSGMWYRDVLLPPHATCDNDDDLVLYFSKELQGPSEK